MLLWRSWVAPAAAAGVGFATACAFWADGARRLQAASDPPGPRAGAGALCDVRDERVVKQVLVCRHGQGQHNTRDARGQPRLDLFDPALTEQGVAEARAIFADAAPGRADFRPDVALVSPLWRTLETATHAMAARTDGHTCPILAMEDVREHNNLNACNQRRPIQAAHHAAFPAVDFSRIDVAGPPPRAEWADTYKESFRVLRARAERALAVIDARPEERVVVFCHATFARALLSAVLQLGPHHAAKAPATGQAFEVWRIETPSGDRYWELVSDRTHGYEVLRLAWRDDGAGGEPQVMERDDGAVASG